MTNDELEHAPSRKKARLSFTDDISVVVGGNKNQFHIHKDVICTRSPFFKAACSDRWATSPRPIELPEDDADIFDIYLHCVYHNRVDVGATEDSLSGEGSASETGKVDLRLVRTYVLADKLGDNVTVNMVIDEIIRWSNSLTNITTMAALALVTSKTTTESPLYRLFLDYFVHDMGGKAFQFSYQASGVPESFVLKVLEEKSQLIWTNRDKKICEVFRSVRRRPERCKYHLHDEAHPSCGASCEKANDK